MNDIEQVILLKLHSMYPDPNVPLWDTLYDPKDRAELAKVLATELLQASLTQLASHLHDNVPSSLFEGFCNELNLNPTEVP